MKELTSIEICAGAGGQALGLEMAGFKHLALVEIDAHACKTLKKNRPEWNVIEGDLRKFSAKEYNGIDLLAGGVPCPPFSVAGNQLGEKDERNLFPEVIRLVAECNPKAIMIENVPGLFDKKFEDYRNSISKSIELLGYQTSWNLLYASNYGVPQLRPRTILVALKNEYSEDFDWPSKFQAPARTVGEVLLKIMSSNGWEKAKEWASMANTIGPTLVGGSKKHGGPDLGPTRARKSWLSLGVDGRGIANEPPMPGYEGLPRLTVKMAALLQGFPEEWEICGLKTPAYRQVGNAFPPPVAKAVGNSIAKAILTVEGRKRVIA